MACYGQAGDGGSWRLWLPELEGAGELTCILGRCQGRSFKIRDGWPRGPQKGSVSLVYSPSLWPVFNRISAQAFNRLTWDAPKNADSWPRESTPVDWENPEISILSKCPRQFSLRCLGDPILGIGAEQPLLKL